jgi:Transglycosylase-like domain
MPKGVEGIELPPVWLPITAETSGIGKQFEDAGRLAKSGFYKGFDADGFGGQAGKDFSSKVFGNFSKGLQDTSVGGAIAGFTSKLTEQTDASLAAAIKGKLPQIYREATAATEGLRAAEQKANEERQRSIAAIEKNRQAIVTAKADVARATDAAGAALTREREATKDATLSNQALNETYRATMTANRELIDAKDRLRTATSQQNTMDRQAIQITKQGQEEIAAAHEKAAQATEKHRSAVEQYTAATESAHSMSGLLGGVIGGAMVAGVNLAVQGFEKLAEVGVDALKESLESAERLGEALLDVGSTFEGLENQIRMFSGATGEAFEAMSASVKGIFGTLDVDGRNLGQTYARLGTVLDAEASPALDELARNVTELQGRFQNLKSQDITEIFYAFHTPIEETSDDLAFLLQSAQNAGMGLGDFAALMAGSVSEAAAAMNLNLRQTALLTEARGKSGIPTRQSVMAIANAQQFFTDKNVAFKDGLVELRREMEAYPDQADALSAKVFGKGVKADIGKQLIGELTDAANASGPALDVPINKLQEFLQATQTLETKIEQFKNKMFDAFAPFGTELTTKVGGALDNLSNWFSQHQSGIAADIEGWGDKFINLLPTIKQFTASAIDMLGPLLDALAEFGSLLMTAAAGAAAITFHWDDVGPFMSAAANLGSLSGTLSPAGQLSGGGPIDKFTGGLKDQINAIDTSTEALDRFKNTLHGATDAMQHGSAPTGDSGGGDSGSSGMPGSGPVGGPGGPAAPGQSPKYGPAMPTHPSAAAPGGGAAPSGAVNGPPMPPHAPHGANWNAIAKFESSGNWADNTNNGYFGGLQFAQSTWEQFGGKQYAARADEASPSEQMAIADKVLKDQGPQAWPTTFSNHPELFVPTASKGLHVTGGTPGVDSVHILAQQGEFVVNKDSYANPKYRQLINFMNGNPKGFKDGGPIDTAGAQVDTIAVGEVAQKLFGIDTEYMYRSPDGYNEHASGEAVDLMVGSNTQLGNSMKDYFLTNAANFGVEYALWQQRQWNPDGTSSPMEDRGSPTQNHMDHVHVRTQGGGFPQGGGPGGQGYAAPSSGTSSNTPAPGVAAVMAGFSTGGSGSFPFGGGGGSGGSGGGAGGGGMGGGFARGTPEYDEEYQRNRAVQRTNEDIGRLTDERKKDAGELSQAQADLNFQENLADYNQDKKKMQELHQKIDELSKRIQKIDNEELPDAQEAHDQAVSKAGEPIKSGSSKSTSMDSEAKSLGSSLLSGIGQSLGFPDIFGKSPDQWGITKLIGGLAKWGFGELNALGDAGGRFGGDQSPQGTGPNLAAGLAQPFGIPGAAFNMMPKAQVPGGGNAPIFNGPSGPAPGPAPQAPGQTPDPRQAPLPPGPIDYKAQYPTKPSGFGTGGPKRPGGSGPGGSGPGGSGPGGTSPPGDSGRLGGTNGPSMGDPIGGLIHSAGFTKQIPANDPNSIVPKPPGQQPISFSKGLPAADFNSSSDQNFGKRWAPGFDGQPTPQGAPWSSLASSLTTMALGFASKMIPNAGSMGGKGGQPAGFQVGGTGGGAGGGGDGQGTPVGATGIMQGYGSVPTFYGGGGGDTHNHNYHAPLNQTTYNIAPATDAQTMQSVQQHQNAQRSNAAMASAPGSLQSYP